MSLSSTHMSLPLDPEARADLAAIAQVSIARGSKSFAAAARLFDADIRRSAMMLYAWCRHCDDTIDGQVLGFARRPAASPATARERVDYLEAETLAALDGRVPREPSFSAIADVAARHDLPRGLLLEHLAGYRMDADEYSYETIGETLKYCYHVAGAVGVMMALVMGSSDEETLDRACDLGIAFQLTNIARDIVEDARAGRIYLPADWLAEADLTPSDLLDVRQRPVVALLANRLVDTAEPYYASAFYGLAALPPRSAWAVATAHGIYREIGLQVKALGAEAWDRRVSTASNRKIAHLGRGALKVALSRRGPSQPRAAHMWTRSRDR